jgi:hypothetical protein
MKVGNAILGSLGLEMPLLEDLCRLLGSLQLAFQENGHKFQANRQ